MTVGKDAGHRRLFSSAQIQSDSALGVTLLRPCPALCRVSTEVAGRLPQSVGGRVEPGHERKGVACV